MRRFRAERDKDGKLHRWVMPNIPEVSSIRCPGDGKEPLVENSVKDGKHRIVICTNRIEARAKNAERLAMIAPRFEMRGMMSARAGLAMARTAIERDRNLTDEQRRDALAGIAQAEAEVRGDVN